MKTLTKLFIVFAFLTLVAMATKSVNAFIFFCLCADVFGVWVIVKSFRSDQWI